MSTPGRTESPAVLPVREALGLVRENGERFAKADWSVHVRGRNSNAFTTLDNIDDWYVENPDFGRIYSAVFSRYVDEAGSPIVGWDQYCIDEGPADSENNARKPGAVVVPWTLQPHPRTQVRTIWIAFVRRYRHTVIDQVSGRQGAWLLELPRGFALGDDDNVEATALREADEELDRRVPELLSPETYGQLERQLGMPVRRVQLLGRTVANSAFYTGSIGVVACDLTDFASEDEFGDPLQVDDLEPFFDLASADRTTLENMADARAKASGVWLPLDAVLAMQRAGLLSDSLTQAALFMFIAQRHLAAA